MLNPRLISGITVTLYEKTGRLWCAMLNHGLFNLANLILLFLIPQ